MAIHISKGDTIVTLQSILQHIQNLASDCRFFGSITVRFQGPLGPTYVITERGQRPSELVEAQNERC